MKRYLFGSSLLFFAVLNVDACCTLRSPQAHPKPRLVKRIHNLANAHQGSAPLQLLVASLYVLGGTPGFNELTQRITKGLRNQALLQGSSYELERALALQETHEILALNYTPEIEHPEIKPREFDILTPTLWIECKNIAWKRLTDSSKIKKQFSEQQLLIGHFNAQHGTAVHYQVSSKQPVPEEWKTWFAMKHIAVHEGL